MKRLLRVIWLKYNSSSWRKRTTLPICCSLSSSFSLLQLVCCCSIFAPHHNSVYCKWCSLHLHAASVSFAPLPSLSSTVFQPSLICLSSWMRQDERTYWLPFNLVGELNELSALSFCSCFLVFLPILLICCFSPFFFFEQLPVWSTVFVCPTHLVIVKVRLDEGKGSLRKVKFKLNWRHVLPTKHCWKFTHFLFISFPFYS